MDSFIDFLESDKIGRPWHPDDAKINMNFREFVDVEDQIKDAKTIILRIIGATQDALDDPLSNFSNYKKLLNRETYPGFAKLIDGSNNREALITAIKNAANTKLSIADLISLFRAGKNQQLPGGRKAPEQPLPQKQQNDQTGNQQPSYGNIETKK